MISYVDELYHHGVKGMKWGVRRFRNEDGSLTEAGKARQQKKQDRAEYLKKYKGPQKALQRRAFNLGYHKSTGRIITQTALTGLAIEGFAFGAARLADKRAETWEGGIAASNAIMAIGGTVLAGALTAGATSAIQKGRHKIP